MISQESLINEMIEKQLPTIVLSNKLTYSDICRISNFIDTSIFSENDCCLWKGYITNPSKRPSILFFFNKKKTSLHRLLYINFVGPLDSNSYLRFICSNKGRCCCIYCMKKFDYIVRKIKNNNINQNINLDLSFNG